MIEAENLRKTKAKGKKGSYAEKKVKSATQSESREASKSARNSLTPDGPVQQDLSASISPFPVPVMQTIINRKRSASIDVAKFDDDDKRRKQKSPIAENLREGIPRPTDSLSNTVHNLAEDEYASHTVSNLIPYAQGKLASIRKPTKLDVDGPMGNNYDGSGEGSTFPSVRKAISSISGYIFHGKSTKPSRQFQEGTSISDTLEIQDSPEKTNSRQTQNPDSGAESSAKKEFPVQTHGPVESSLRNREATPFARPLSASPSQQANDSGIPNSQAVRLEEMQLHDAKPRAKIPGGDDQEMLLKQPEIFGAHHLSSPDMSPLSSPPAMKEQESGQSRATPLESQQGSHPKHAVNGTSYDLHLVVASDEAVVGRHRRQGPKRVTQINIDD